MIVDAVRWVAEACTDGTTGINALRTAVPIDVGDTTPAAVTISHEFGSAAVARGEIEREAITSAPVLHIRRVNDVTAFASAERQHGGSSIDVLLRWAARGANTHELKRDALQILRCAMRSIATAFNDATFDGIARNGIAFDPPTFRLLEETEDPGDDVVFAELIVTVRALDEWALGGT